MLRCYSLADLCFGNARPADLQTCLGSGLTVSTRFNTLMLRIESYSASAPCCTMCRYHRIRSKLFDRLDERNGDAKSSSELAKLTGADPDFTGRLWHLPNISGCYEENLRDRPQRVRSNSISRAPKEPIYRDAYSTMFVLLGICLI